MAKQRDNYRRRDSGLFLPDDELVMPGRQRARHDIGARRGMGRRKCCEPNTNTCSRCSGDVPNALFITITSLEGENCIPTCCSACTQLNGSFILDFVGIGQCGNISVCKWQYVFGTRLCDGAILWPWDRIKATMSYDSQLSYLLDITVIDNGWCGGDAQSPEWYKSFAEKPDCSDWDELEVPAIDYICNPSLSSCYISSLL